MKNKYLKLLISFCVILFGIISLLPNKVFSATTSSVGYVIENYDIEMIVNDDNTFDIIETIDVKYSSFYNHDTFRIDVNLLKYSEKDKADKYIKITNIDCNYEFSGYGSKIYEVFINKNDNKEQRYILKYKLNFGKDYTKDKDEINYIILDNVGKINVEKVSFKINMPKGFDSSKLEFLDEQLNQSNIKYTINNNVIVGETLDKLKSGDSITMKLALPEGYFSDAKASIDDYLFLLNFVPIICLIISLIIWYKYGKDDKIIETVEFRRTEWVNETELLLNEGDFINERKYFEKFNWKSIIIIILLIISYISFWVGIGSVTDIFLLLGLEIPTIPTEPNSDNLGLILLFFMLFSPFIILGVFRSQEKIIRYGAGLGILARIVIIITIVCLIKGMIESSFHIYYIWMLSNIIIMIIMLLLYYFMFKRTKYANDIIGKSRGYKRFKKAVDEDKKY